MTVYDFCNMCIDNYSPIDLYDTNNGTVVFSGTMYDALYSDYSEYEVVSFDPPVGDKLTINIE